MTKLAQLRGERRKIKAKMKKRKEKILLGKQEIFLLILSETKTDRILLKDAVYTQKLPEDPDILEEDLKVLDRTMLQPSRYKKD